MAINFTEWSGFVCFEGYLDKLFSDILKKYIVTVFIDKNAVLTSKEIKHNILLYLGIRQIDIKIY